MPSLRNRGSPRRAQDSRGRASAKKLLCNVTRSCRCLMYRSTPVCQLSRSQVRPASRLRQTRLCLVMMQMLDPTQCRHLLRVMLG